jgi:hypothetical protein
VHTNIANDAIRRASSRVSNLAADREMFRRRLRWFLEPHRHSHQRNNDTDDGKTKHDAIGIELW